MQIMMEYTILYVDRFYEAQYMKICANQKEMFHSRAFWCESSVK